MTEGMYLLYALLDADSASRLPPERSPEVGGPFSFVHHDEGNFTWRRTLHIIQRLI